MKQELRELLKKTRLWSMLRKDRFIFTNQQDQYKNFEIGDWTYGSPTVLRWNDETRLEIGKFCSIAKGVQILLGGEHHLHWVTTYPLYVFLANEETAFKQPHTKGNIIIGNDVWIGVNAVILSGVTIGNGAVVGAASVVTRDIPPYTIAAGNPAKPIRKRFEDPIIQALLKISWWDWPVEQIKEAIPLLLSSDLTAFVAKYSRETLSDDVLRRTPRQTVK
jgi:acetyltransferase-like isoleucine patch superfamily enzyme